MLLALLATLIAATFLFASHAHAADAPPPEQWRMFDRTWVAGSTTAMGVTGNARLTPTSVTFARGVTYKLRYLSEIATTAPPEKTYANVRRFSLFEFVDPKPQMILRGNDLCGELPHYLAAGLSPESETKGDSLLMIVFRSERPPKDALQDDGFCAGYLYIRSP
jgi:hypothetical protein